MSLPVKHTIFIYISSQQAEAGPPLGTVLGNLGLNTIKFCKDFNEITKDLPLYFVLRVQILINENRSFSFNIFSPPLSSIINLLKFEREIIIKGRRVLQNCITLSDVIKLSCWQFPKFPLIKGVPIILGTIKSFSLIVIQ